MSFSTDATSISLKLGRSEFLSENRASHGKEMLKFEYERLYPTP
jgi:hypothetical protein